MPALVAGIHVLKLNTQDVDGRNRSGHDANKLSGFEICPVIHAANPHHPHPALRNGNCALAN
ncbi:hypothetical protein OCAR_4507 [Afipia carboxidovorans OM5]|nr:hypothetical protein OCAR_4507 [Afipia carboxidovorans OM5]